MILAWLIFQAFAVVGHGNGVTKSEAYSTESAKYDCSTDMLIFCHARGGDSLALVGYSKAECTRDGDLYRCQLDCSAYCERTEP